MIVPRGKCPGNRRGHTWKELPLSALGRRDLELRKCARCNALGRVSKQGVIHVVEAP